MRRQRLFQHTATRRWLNAKVAQLQELLDVSTHSHAKVAEDSGTPLADDDVVSTHSHAKVAEHDGAAERQSIQYFNTQPREGG